MPGVPALAPSRRRAAAPSPATPSAARSALIVEGGAAPHVVAAARALTAAGWRVGVATAGDAMPMRSRVVANHHTVPAAEAGPESFVTAVAELAEGYDVVFGADDIEVLMLSASRDRIPSVIPYGSHESVVGAIDKLTLTDAAQRAGLATPTTRRATASALAAVSGPVVIKARLHWRDGATARRHQLAVLCSTPVAARQAATAMTAAGAEPLVQDHVDGELTAITTVIDRLGRPLGLVQQRSPRLSARRTSCRAETVPVDPGLAGRVLDLLRDLGWVGLANVQFLRPPGGEAQLIDFNGRFYGSLALAVSAGVNLPDLWGRVALGEAVDPAAPARPGVRFQSLLEDLARARAERRRGVVSDVLGSLLYAAGAAHPHFALDDPGPATAVLRRRFR